MRSLRNYYEEVKDMLKSFMKESLISIMWLSTMAYEAVCAVCVAVYELLNEN